MNQPQIDLARLVLHGLRRVDDGRKAIEEQWQRLTSPAKNAGAGRDRRRPPEVW